MSSLKILLVGATGYIGGSVLSTLLGSGIHSTHAITVLVRGEDKAKALEELGVKTVTFKDLDEVELLRTVAGQHDIVINAGPGFNTAAAKAFVLGLGDRKKQTGREIHYIHTSGTSNLGDQPITGEYHENHIFSDEEDIYGYMKKREALQTYSQRTTDLTVVETGLEVGVATHIIMSPLIYGFGTGLFNKLSIQIPTIIRTSIKDGETIFVREGKGIWNYVHIADLANLYHLLVSKIISGENIPTGKKGILFSATGDYMWKELSEGIANALFSLNSIKSSTPQSVDLQEAAARWFGDGKLTLLAELGFASK
jgi:nucleoside-diphosphate-sugar epimerase